MGRPGKFKKEQVAEMVGLMNEQTVTAKEETMMKITDEEMCSILCAAGFEVSISYVKRLRQAYGISARNKKFFDDDVARIHVIIKQYVSGGDGTDETGFPNFISYVLGEYVSGNGTNETQVPWKMTVSDAAMAEILKEAGYDVNAKYVERTRRSLGIKPFQERLPQGQKRQRLLPGGGDILAALHEQAVLQLSIYRSGGSCNMYGTAGVDTYTQGIGAHTLSFNDAIERKEKQIQRLQNAEKKRQAEELSRKARALEFMLDHGINPFGDVIATGCYSRGHGGARRSQHDAQVYQSIY